MLNLVATMLLLAVPVVAQVAPTAGTNATPSTSAARTPIKSDDEVTVSLSPFEVKADSDRSYGALNSNTITGFNAELGTLPISADIMTSAFIRDTASSTMEDLVATYSAGAGMGAAPGDQSGNTAPLPFDRGSAYQGVELRGLGGTITKQDGFIDPARTGIGLNSLFGVERVEIINGPQSLLYGNGGAGGVINVISKQARLYQASGGSVKFQVDQYGHKLGQWDYNTSAGNLAVIVSAINQQLGSYRQWIGGELNGYYIQLAKKVMGNTTVRLTGKQTLLNRYVNSTPSLTAGSTAIDQRNGLNLHYLMATNQLASSATGASGAGVIGNGVINWANVDSYAGAFHEEYTKGRYGSLAVESVWTKWLSTQFTVGYQSSTDRYNAANVNFYSPTASSNPIPGNWTAAPNSTTLINQEPGRSKAIRLTALLTNDLFNGRAHSQTIVGTDFYRSDSANIAYAYYKADSNFNVIVNPAVAANNGRTIMPTPSWTVNSGPVKYPLWAAGSPHITLNGVNYVLMVQDPVDPALISPTNPLGVTTVNGSFYLQSEALNRGIFGMNSTSWLSGDLTTLAGFRYVGAYYKLASQAPGRLAGKADNFDFNVGANYKLTQWMRPYFSLSNSFNLPVIVFSPNPTDPYGNPPVVSHSLGQEVGVKLGSPDGAISGSVALYHVNAKNEQYLIGSNLLALINPAGLNGRFGAPSTYINVARESEGIQAALTAAPTPALRMRLSLAAVKGTIHSTTSYPVVYNDQFYQDSQGEVTYKDGTVVYVTGTATNAATAKVVPSTTAGAIPLTIAAMSNPASVYYANPVAIIGQINSGSVAATMLKTIDPVHGPILTGLVGLPIAKIQINPGYTPISVVPTSQAGDSTVGYPRFSLNNTNVYTIPQGELKGVKIGGTIGLGWRRANYYYYSTTYAPGVTRNLFYLPTLVRFDGILGYERKFKRVLWSTQLNVNNMFNRYHVVIWPNAINGYGGVDDAVFDQQPRLYTISSTLSF